MGLGFEEGGRGEGVGAGGVNWQGGSLKSWCL